MRKMHIPAELHVPITAEIEDDLKYLVAKFGEKKVLEALDLLVTKCKWNDWQCVANAVQIANASCSVACAKGTESRILKNPN